MIQAYAERKGMTFPEANDYLIEFALRTIEARRKGGANVGNRPEQKKVLARARKLRFQDKEQTQ